MTGTALAEALVVVPTPPCEPCPWSKHCARRLHACEAFLQYVRSNTGHWSRYAERKPTRVLYQLAHPRR